MAKLVERVLEDFRDIPIEHFSTGDPYDEESHETIKTRFWTGTVEFKKTSPDAEASAPPVPTEPVIAPALEKSSKKVIAPLAGDGDAADDEDSAKRKKRTQVIANMPRRYYRKVDNKETLLENDLIGEGMINPCTHAVED